jgi:hypothetical protein
VVRPLLCGSVSGSRGMYTVSGGDWQSTVSLDEQCGEMVVGTGEWSWGMRGVVLSSRSADMSDRASDERLTHGASGHGWMTCGAHPREREERARRVGPVQN